MALDQPLQLGFRRVRIPIQRERVHRRERSGNPDVIRTYLRAIIAGSTGNQRNRRERLARLLKCLPLTRVKRLKISHERIREIQTRLFYAARNYI